MIKKKFWTHYEQVRFIIEGYITLLFTIPYISLAISSLTRMSEIEAGVEGALKTAILNGLKWYAIIMSVVTVLYAVWFLRYSDRIEWTDNCIKYYYAGIFSKKFRKIPYDKITRVVLCDGLWWHNGDYYRGRKIIFFNKNDIIFELEISPKLCLSVMMIFAQERVWIVNQKQRLKKVDDYFKIDFMGLTQDQQLALFKFYCKPARADYKTGEEILRKRRKKKGKNPACDDADAAESGGKGI